MPGCLFLLACSAAEAAAPSLDDAPIADVLGCRGVDDGYVDKCRLREVLMVDDQVEACFRVGVGRWDVLLQAHVAPEVFGPLPQCSY